MNGPGDVAAAGATRAYVGIGANLGDAAAAVTRAAAAVGALPHTSPVALSSLYRSAPVDAQGPDFVNAVVAIDTALSAEDLLSHLHRIEMSRGRERPYRNAPRTLDLDLLLWSDRQCRLPVLTLPHPRMHLRAFVLEPLAEVAPDLILPGLGPLGPWRAAASDQALVRIGPA